MSNIANGVHRKQLYSNVNLLCKSTIWNFLLLFIKEICLLLQDLSLSHVKRKFSKDYIDIHIYIYLNYYFLTGLQTQIHSRCDVLYLWFMSSLYNENKCYQTITVFLLVLPLILFTVLFPEVGRNMVRKAMRGLPEASENIVFLGCLPFFSAAGCCLSAEMTEQPACVIQHEVSSLA